MNRLAMARVELLRQETETVADSSNGLAFLGLQKLVWELKKTTAPPPEGSLTLRRPLLLGLRPSFVPLLHFSVRPLSVNLFSQPTSRPLRCRL